LSQNAVFIEEIGKILAIIGCNSTSAAKDNLLLTDHKINTPHEIGIQSMQLKTYKEMLGVHYTISNYETKDV